MAFFHVLLNGTGTSGDGSTWADDSSGTAAYIGEDGFVAAAAATSPGDTIYIKGSEDVNSPSTLIFPTTLAGTTNPVRVIGVKTGTTNLNTSVVQSDLIPGIRTGQSTRAYAWGGGTPPTVDVQGSNLGISGNVYIYGMIFISDDDIDICITTNNTSDEVVTLEECSILVGTSSDDLNFGGDPAAQWQRYVRMVHCKISIPNSNSFIDIVGSNVHLDFFDCEIDNLGVIKSALAEGGGVIRFRGSDLSGSAATLIDISTFKGGVDIGYLNCKMPASHVLTTGTAVARYTVANYGSDDSTGLNSADSEQEFEIITHEGTVDKDTAHVRTGGADDEATDSGGPFAYAMVPNNVTDNFIGVVSPWMKTWIEGDGTAQTLNVYIANSDAESAANNLETDEVYLEVQCPGEDGSSMYTSWPDAGAPGDGGGLMQLLGTAVDLTTTSETWGSGANNDQKLTQSIAPNYRGNVYARIIYSKASGPTLYLDPLLEIV